MSAAAGNGGIGPTGVAGCRSDAGTARPTAAVPMQGGSWDRVRSSADCLPYAGSTKPSGAWSARAGHPSKFRAPPPHCARMPAGRAASSSLRSGRVSTHDPLRAESRPAARCGEGVGRSLPVGPLPGGLGCPAFSPRCDDGAGYAPCLWPEDPRQFSGPVIPAKRFAPPIRCPARAAPDMPPADRSRPCPRPGATRTDRRARGEFADERHRCVGTPRTWRPAGGVCPLPAGAGWRWRDGAT